MHIMQTYMYKCMRMYMYMYMYMYMLCFMYECTEWNGMDWNGMECNEMLGNVMTCYVCVYACKLKCILAAPLWKEPFAGACGKKNTKHLVRLPRHKITK